MPTSTKHPSQQISQSAQPLANLLSRANSPETAHSLLTTKLLHKPLHLRPTPSTTNARDARRLTRLRKKAHFISHQRPKPLSAREQRVLGIYELPKREQKWEVYESLRKLWAGYAREVLGLEGGVERGQEERKLNVQGLGQLVATMDFHGAVVEVVRCKDVGRVGCKGTLVREGKFAVVVVREKGGARTIPKRNTVFRFEVPLLPPETGDTEDSGKEPVTKKEPFVFEVHGSQIEARPADRANRKFKWKVMDYL
ncbi:MAG: hypothetical protein Q9227_005227 [Pyrenula ochraceoflavens]